MTTIKPKDSIRVKQTSTTTLQDLAKYLAQRQIGKRKKQGNFGGDAHHHLF